MKKLFILLALLYAVLFTVEAQKIGTLSAKDPAGSWLIDAKLVASDTIGANDSIWHYTIRPNKGERLYYDMYMQIDSIGGTGGVVGQCPVILQGRRLSVDAWTNIDTAKYSVSADTTFKFSQVSTAQFYTEYRIYVKGINDSFAVRFRKLIARFWY